MYTHSFSREGLMFIHTVISTRNLYILYTFNYIDIIYISVVNAYSITSPGNIYIQVQPVRYQSQPGHDPNGYNRGTTKVTSTGRDLVIYLNNI